MPAAVPDPVLGEDVCEALRCQVRKLGLSIGDEPMWCDAQFRELRDPASGELSIAGSWRGKLRDGMLNFFPDGRVFAEYQVLLPHPHRADSFVEAVQVWGTAGHLRGDVVISRYAA